VATRCWFMKKRGIFLLISLLIICGIIFTGCVQSSQVQSTPREVQTTPSVQTSPSVQSTVTSSYLSPPKYVAGDLVYTDPTNKDTVWIILDYDPSTDEYLWAVYMRNSGEILGSKDWRERSFVDIVYKVKIGHVEPYILTTTPIPTTILQSPTSTSQQIQTVKAYAPLVVVVGSETLEITVSDYNRGLYANNLVATTNRYNDVPRENFEYLLIHPRVINKKGISPIHVSELDFKACIQNTSRCYDTEATVLPFPYFGDAYLKQGDKIDGWISFIVPTGVDIKLAYTDLHDNPLGYILIK